MPSKSGTHPMADPIPETAGQPPDLHIDIARAGDRLKISAFEQIGAEAHTVCHYDEIPIPLDKIAGRCHEIVRTLNMANRRGQVPHDVLGKLKEIGQIFSDDLFTPHVKEMVSQTRADHLIIHLDDQMVHVPWELLYDGRRFLCQRFGMGRLVRTRQNCPGGNRPRSLSDPLRMLILADPAVISRGLMPKGFSCGTGWTLKKSRYRRPCVRTISHRILSVKRSGSLIWSILPGTAIMTGMIRARAGGA